MGYITNIMFSIRAKGGISRLLITLRESITLKLELNKVIPLLKQIRVSVSKVLFT